MRYIDNRNDEPDFLTKYREETPDAVYEGARIDKEQIRKSLLEEQGYICAYCMCKISVDSSTIEHYISQEKHPDSPLSEDEHRKQSLMYSNMSAVCVNNGEHCDKSRGNTPMKILNPHLPSCERLITYNLEGEVVAVGDKRGDVQADCDVLKLNHKNLIKFRRTVWEEIWERYKNNHKKGITRDMLLKEAELYKARITKRGRSRFHAYCNYIVWGFEYYAENYNKLQEELNHRI